MSKTDMPAQTPHIQATQVEIRELPKVIHNAGAKVIAVAKELIIFDLRCMGHAIFNADGPLRKLGSLPKLWGQLFTNTGVYASFRGNHTKLHKPVLNTTELCTLWLQLGHTSFSHPV